MISRNLVPDAVLDELVEQSMQVFGADRAMVSITGRDGFEALVSRGVSAAWVEATRRLPEVSLGNLAIREGRALASIHYASDPRGADMRSQVLAEGFDTVALAPLIADEFLGFLALYHDEPRPYDAYDLEALLSVADHAVIAIRNSRAFAHQARWIAQLASIHDLGSRLSALTTVPQIAEATVSELHTIIPYHSVRVYCVEGEHVVPVAWRSEHEDYREKTLEQLTVRIGHGITGWVAQYGVAQYLPDASRDPRTETIPGTQAGLDETLMVVPMVHDATVIGVIVLSKQGLDQFDSDERRLLETYASLAGQAMANAQATHQKLRESEARLRAVVDSVEDAVVTCDRRGRVVAWNGGAERIFGAPAEAAVGWTLAALVASDQHVTLQAAVDRVIAADGAERSSVELRCCRPNGAILPAELSLAAWDSGDERFVTALIRDITARRQAEATLRDSENKHRQLVEHVPVVLYTAEHGPHGRWLYVSDRVEALVGYLAAEWLANPDLWLSLVHPDDRAFVVAERHRTWARPAGQRLVMEYRMIARDGRVCWVSDEASIVRPEDGSAATWSGFLVDVTERKALQEQLRHEAFHDSLTGLSNRVLFADRVDHAIARCGRNGRSLAVLFLDLDDFKTVNDGLGHAAGDALLIAVADRLRSCTRPGDTVSRLGGDEFGVLLEDQVDPDEAIAVADRIQLALTAPIAVQHRDIALSASIGIAQPISSADRSAEVLRNADVAMYAAKRSGKGRSRVYEPSMHAIAVRRLELDGDIRRALERGGFTVHYQHQIRLNDGGIAGFEALVRWRHPRHTADSIAELITSAEETGQILALGRYVLSEACHQARAWRDLSGASAPWTMSVNVSARQLGDPTFVETVAATLSASGLDPGSLVLEITESVVMDDSDALLERLHALKALGIRLAIDDFGTGYSSLSYLRRLPVDILKVDKSFIDAIDVDDEAFKLTRVIVRMARTLHLSVIAEGVERASQVARLRRIGCEMAQGFYFARPLSAAGMSAQLTDPTPFGRSRPESAAPTLTAQAPRR